MFVLAWSSTASATPKPLPFSYGADTNPKGTGEVEQYVDLVPARATSLENGNPADVLLPQLQTEIEWGLTNHVELALYATIVPSSPSNVTSVSAPTEHSGAKQRLRFRLFDEGVLPIDTGFYFEVVESTAELELESKIILEKHFGRLRIGTNLWAEREQYFSGRGEWVLNPTLGAHVEIAPWLHVGAEGWMRVEFPDSLVGPRPFALGPHVYVGPTTLISFGRFWWSVGAYLRASDFGRSPDPGDSFGAVWVRTMLGVEL